MGRLACSRAAQGALGETWSWARQKPSQKCEKRLSRAAPSCPPPMPLAPHLWQPLWPFRGETLTIRSGQAPFQGPFWVQLPFLGSMAPSPSEMQPLQAPRAPTGLLEACFLSPHLRLRSFLWDPSPVPPVEIPLIPSSLPLTPSKPC